MSNNIVLATDTNIFMQRAHYVHEDLKRPDGYPSGIVYGTIVSLSQMIKRLKPDYFLPVFDVGKSNHRKQISGDYKGNRQRKDEPMINQFDAVRILLDIMGFNPYYEPGVEADDLLAKLAIHHSEDKQIVIATQDHDMFQLISDRVSVYRPALGKRAESLLTIKNARLEFGIEPNRLAEVWAISGDGGDNVKGVPGYGPKKSLKAILDHGTLQNAIINDPKIRPHAQTALQSYQLVKLDGSVAKKEPILIPLDKLLDEVYDNDEVMEFFDLWGMKTLMKEYGDRTLFTP